MLRGRRLETPLVGVILAFLLGLAWAIPLQQGTLALAAAPIGLLLSHLVGGAVVSPLQSVPARARKASRSSLTLPLFALAPSVAVVRSSQVHVERVVVDSPSWHAASSTLKMHHYTVAIFTTTFREPMLLRRARIPCDMRAIDRLSAAEAAARNATASAGAARDTPEALALRKALEACRPDDDADVWASLGLGALAHGHGLLRLRCGAALFESYPFLSARAQAAAVPAVAPGAALDALLLAPDTAGPPVFLVPLVPGAFRAAPVRSSAAAGAAGSGSGSAAAGADHPVYDLLRASVPFDD